MTLTEHAAHRSAPPLLVGAAVLFWGWQTGLLFEGACMAGLIEAAWIIKVRWEFSEEDAIRIWNFCSLLVLAAAVYSFSSSGMSGNLSGLIRNPSFANQNSTGHATTQAAVSLLRMLPPTFFMFVLSRAFATQPEAPVTIFSLFMRRRRQKALARGETLEPVPRVNVSSYFVAVCLFSASAHGGQGISFFWGFALLVLWGLWAWRASRFTAVVWATAAAVALAAGYFGQREIIHLQKLVENYNPGWFSGGASRGFDPKENRTEIGSVGRIKNSGKIQLRVEVPPGVSPPAYLREATYRTYKTAVWYAGTSKDDFQPLTPEPDATTWVIPPPRVNASTMKIACYVPGGKGLLPLPLDAGKLENLPADTVQTNHLGSVFMEGPGFVMFDALYGSGRSQDAPGNTNEDLEVNPKEWPVLDRVIEGLKLPLNPSPALAMKSLTSFFAGQFSYSLYQGPMKIAGTNETPLGRFLLRSKSGHCEYFATSTVLLLRRLGIPARYTVGWSVHEGSGKQYVVRQRDAHAWCLVWEADNKRWTIFDTTPGTWINSENERISPLQFLGDAWSRLMFEFSKLRWGQTNLRQYLLWLFVPVLGLLLFQIVFRSGRKRRADGVAGPIQGPDWPGLDSEFYQLETALGLRGFTRRAGELSESWLHRVATEPTLGSLVSPLTQAIQLHHRYRFDPLGLPQPGREELRRLVQDCLVRLGRPEKG